MQLMLLDTACISNCWQLLDSWSALAKHLYLAEDDLNERCRSGFSIRKLATLERNSGHAKESGSLHLLGSHHAEMCHPNEKEPFGLGNFSTNPLAKLAPCAQSHLGRPLIE